MFLKLGDVGFSAQVLWSKRVFHFPCTGCSSVFPEEESLAVDTHTMVANIFSISVVFFIISVALFGTLTITELFFNSSLALLLIVR